MMLDLAPPPDAVGWDLEVTAGLAGRDWVKKFRPAAYSCTVFNAGASR